MNTVLKGIGAYILRLLKSRFLWVNMLLLVVTAFILVYGSLAILKAYTNHGESITVPDLRGLTVDQLDNLMKSKSLRYKVKDSTYRKDKLPHAVIEQSPKAGAKVKEGRRIYLTINASVPPNTKLPGLVDASLRSAKIQLANAGLELGELIYEPFIGKNVVMEMRVNGDKAESGSLIRKGTKVTLIVGDGLGEQRIPVPRLVGLTYNEARTALKMHYLIVGGVIKDPDVKDIEESYVYKQNPRASGGNRIREGEPVDIYLQHNPVEVEEDWEEWLDTVGGSNVVNFNQLDSTFVKIDTGKIVVDTLLQNP